jgi:transcriptional regulator with XRE-family HTH domain
MVILQRIFIENLKKFRKKRGISQMALAEMCDSSGNYIGEIETGRRIPSFEKIERIASALRVAPHQLFMREDAETHEEEGQNMKDFLETFPAGIKKELVSRLLDALRTGVYQSFDPKNY